MTEELTTQDFGLEQNQSTVEPSLEEGNQLSNVEEAQPETSQEAIQEGSQYYSDEEFINLIKKSPIAVEESKVPNHLRPFYESVLNAYKSMQADYTRKTQEIAEIKKQLIEQAKPKPSNIFEAYLQDPDGVSNYIDQEILKANQEADYETAEKLRLLKTRLIEERTKYLERMISGEKIYQQVYGTILSHIPDYETKKDKLTNFAIQEFGLTPEEIMMLTNPQITGALAAKLTIAVNKIYDKLHATKLAEQKIKKQTPSPLARASGAGSDKSAPKTLEEIFYG